MVETLKDVAIGRTCASCCRSAATWRLVCGSSLALCRELVSCPELGSKCHCRQISVARSELSYPKLVGCRVDHETSETLSRLENVSILQFDAWSYPFGCKMSCVRFSAQR